MNYINKGKRDILIFPDFENIYKIQEIRKKYDELFDIIMPHITLAFPFENNISNNQLKTELLDIIKEVKPFKIKCKGIKLKRDHRINTYYIFLNIVEGQEQIIKMHKQIYSKILSGVDISKYDYEPHITLGNTNNSNEEIDLSEEFETIIDNIIVESIGENEESIMEFKINL